MKTTTYIPTLKRIGKERQRTLDFLLRKSSVQPWLVCPPEEVEEHRKYWHQVLACPHKGIGPTRQFILEACPTPGCIMMDDDMEFYIRNEELRLREPESIDPLFDWISAQLAEGYVHGGVSARQGNNYNEEPTATCTRVNNTHFFCKETFHGEQLRFDALPVMEDFFVTLSLLSLGYPNIVTYDWAWGQKASGEEGGCSEYRTKEVQAQGAELLKRHFPDFVRVVEKESVSGHSAFAGIRKDVVVSWKKATGTRAHLRKLV